MKSLINKTGSNNTFHSSRSSIATDQSFCENDEYDNNGGEFDHEADLMEKLMEDNEDMLIPDDMQRFLNEQYGDHNDADTDVAPSSRASCMTQDMTEFSNNPTPLPGEMPVDMPMNRDMPVNRDMQLNRNMQMNAGFYGNQRSNQEAMYNTGNLAVNQQFQEGQSNCSDMQMGNTGMNMQIMQNNTSMHGDMQMNPMWNQGYNVQNNMSNLPQGSSSGLGPQQMMMPHPPGKGNNSGGMGSQQMMMSHPQGKGGNSGGVGPQQMMMPHPPGKGGNSVGVGPQQMMMPHPPGNMNAQTMPDSNMMAAQMSGNGQMQQQSMSNMQMQNSAMPHPPNGPMPHPPGSMPHPPGSMPHATTGMMPHRNHSNPQSMENSMYRMMQQQNMNNMQMNQQMSQWNNQNMNMQNQQQQFIPHPPGMQKGPSQSIQQMQAMSQGMMPPPQVSPNKRENESPQVQVPHISTSNIPPRAKGRSQMMRQQQNQQMTNQNAYNNMKTNQQKQNMYPQMQQEYLQQQAEMMPPPPPVYNQQQNMLTTQNVEMFGQNMANQMVPNHMTSQQMAGRGNTMSQGQRNYQGQGQRSFPSQLEMSPGCNQVTSSTDRKENVESTIEDFMENINSISTENLMDNITSVSENMCTPTAMSQRSNSQASSRYNPSAMNNNMVVNDMSSVLVQLAEENKYLNMRHWWGEHISCSTGWTYLALKKKVQFLWFWIIDMWCLLWTVQKLYNGYIQSNICICLDT